MILCLPVKQPENRPRRLQGTARNFWVWWVMGNGGANRVELPFDAPTPRDASAQLMAQGGFYLHEYTAHGPALFVPFWRVTGIAFAPVPANASDPAPDASPAGK
jgi:hypothetical protein